MHTKSRKSKEAKKTSTGFPTSGYIPRNNIGRNLGGGESRSKAEVIQVCSTGKVVARRGPSFGLVNECNEW